MPYTKKRTYKKKVYKKKAYVKKAYKPSPTSNLSMVTFGKGFPKKCSVTHKYNEIVEISSTLGSIGNHQFVANGLFDPNFTSGGHQPMYFDQFSAIYDHYTVIGSKITAKVMHKTSAGVPMTVAVFLNDDSAISGSILSSMKEQNKSNYIQLAAADNNIRKIGLNYSTKKTFGGSILGNDNLQGTISSNPTETSFFTFVAQCTDGVSSSTLVLDVMIEFIVVWDELRDIGGS